MFVILHLINDFNNELSKFWLINLLIDVLPNYFSTNPHLESWPRTKKKSLLSLLMMMINDDDDGSDNIF